MSETNGVAENVQKPLLDLQDVLETLQTTGGLVSKAKEDFEAIVANLPVGVSPQKVTNSIHRRLTNLSKTVDSVFMFLDKKNKTMATKISSSAKREQRKAEKVVKAQERIEKQKAKLAAMQKLTGESK